ncbi:DJ-1/PfpI family protein [Tunicatimonas pelagia]|uniref:DJ-1/PfpI family protein n=1 Tax=Tunicatimonas pelagia TaxID=931531 RepID=UPI002666338C|nr:DJ-1/PfpI family protein [Tunicatimonas pelagia]WKN41908.1 DJ-1/PfpI family protein [Tunicatimonas pelagia]
MIRLSFLALLLCFACQNSAPTEEPSADSLTEVISAEDSLLIARLTKDFTPENHFDMMNEVFGASDYQVQTIGILVYDGVNDLDVIGSRYVLGQTMGAVTQLIATEPGNVRTVMGVEIVPDAVIDSVDQLDILVIPGGFQGTIEAAYDEALHDWIRQIDQQTTFTAAVCTGGWILGATGLLEGKRATTNWYRAEEMLEKFGATFTDERFTRDGKYWTSAGVTAGMDMSLAIMEELWGERYAQAVMLDMEYDPAPPIEGGTPDKTGAVVYQMMKGMYDMGVQPLMDSLENVPNS